ncbi:MULTISPECIES: hypothetical protein [unclassified Luteibacter]|uniref:hypothetical protein n=1 Tax=Luteibacter sp. PvP019 TaxID=3156436 RepID=UPI00339B2B22
MLRAKSFVTAIDSFRARGEDMRHVFLAMLRQLLRQTDYPPAYVGHKVDAKAGAARVFDIDFRRARWRDGQSTRTQLSKTLAHLPTHRVIFLLTGRAFRDIITPLLRPARD